MDQRVQEDIVEGQRAGRMVHIHCYSVGDNVFGDEGFCVIVQDRVRVRAVQAPGLTVQSKQAVITVSSPFDSFVAHCYRNISTPLNLPVTRTSQPICAQQLRAVKSLWMIRIWLLCIQTHHLSVAVRQLDPFVYCVWVDCELIGI